MKIVIPTYKRLHKQTTLKTFEALADRVWLVVRPEEADEARRLHPQVAVIDRPVSNFSETIDWICRVGFPGELIWICDDDLRLREYNDVGGEHLAALPLTDDIAERAYARVCELAKQFTHGGLFVPSYPAYSNSYPYVVNRRYYTNKWYDLGRIDLTDIDITSLPIGQDFYVMLQLYEAGHDFVCAYDFAMIGSSTNAPGGCSAYRTIELHNESMKMLADRFPQWVSLRSKRQRGGPWANQDKLAAMINIHRKPRQ